MELKLIKREEDNDQHGSECSDARDEWLKRCSCVHPIYERKRCAYISIDLHIVMVASVTPDVGDFAVYWGATAGVNPDREWEEVVQFGIKVPEPVARYYWPHLFKWFRWRT